MLALLYYLLLTKKAAKLEGCAKSSLTGYVALRNLDLEHIEAADALGCALKVRSAVPKGLSWPLQLSRQAIWVEV